MEMNNQAEILRRCTERRPHVVLAWDDTSKKIVAPPTQVGMSWNHAFSGIVPYRTGLVDNFDVPKGIFELSNLDGVLTMEAWESCLSESEKELLSIYLPQGVDQGTAVRALLNRENLQFGNPVRTWGASVCSGAMHPDNIAKRECVLRKSRNSQRRHLRSYHLKMVRKLRTMKDIWSECRSNGELLPRIHRWMKSSQVESIYSTRNGYIPPKRANESDDGRTKDERCRERLEDHKTATKDKNAVTHKRLSAKRLKTGLVENGSVGKEVHQSDLESDFFKKYVEVSVGALTRDQLSDITVPVKVSRKQFENLKVRRQAGEEVDFDSLDTGEGDGSTSKSHKKKNEVDIKEAEELKRYWREQVVKSVPGAHTKFLEMKTRLVELADSFARSCMEERAYVMRSNEEPCSPDRVDAKSDDDRIPTDAADSGAEDETLSQNWRGKHFPVREDAEDEFHMQSPEEEAMDLDSPGDEGDVNPPDENPDEDEGRSLDVPSRSGETTSSNGSSPVSKVEVDGKSQEVEISFTPESTSKDVKAEESFESEASVVPSTSLDNHEEQRPGGDILPGYESEQLSLGESILITGQHTFSAEAAKSNFGFPEKQELQLLPHARSPFLHPGAVPQPVQEPGQLFTEHIQTSGAFENPISDLIKFSKRQHQFNVPPRPVPQHPCSPYTSSPPLPMAVPVVEVVPMWPGNVPRSSPASTLHQFGGGQNGSWPLSEGTSSGSGWDFSGAVQSTSLRAQQQVTPPVPPAPPLPRWDIPNQNVYPPDQTVRKPERGFDQQQVYNDWSSRAEYSMTTAHTESGAPYRAPTWYSTSAFDNVSNPVLGNSMQPHLPHQRHSLWPTESVPSKPVPQLWGNMNWRPT